MYKIEMKDFVAHLMVEMKKEELYISHIRFAVDKIIRKGLVEKTEDFCDSLESVLGIIIDYPEMFKLTQDCKQLETVAFYKVEAKNIAMENPLPAEITDAIKTIAKELNMSLEFTLSTISHANRNDKQIDYNYLDWLCGYLDRCKKISSRGNYLCKTRKDIANFCLFQNLHSKLYWYYVNNWITPYFYEGKDWYAFKHEYQGKEYSIIIMCQQENEHEIYYIQSIEPRKEIVSFSSVENNIPDAKVDERKELLKDILNLFNKAEALDFDYNNIVYHLDHIYGKNEK